MNRNGCRSAHKRRPHIYHFRMSESAGVARFGNAASTGPYESLPSRPRLLVIDDDPGITAVVGALAGAVGFDVQVNNGEPDLDDVLAGGHDVIILDLMMPVVDGVEVIERLAGLGSGARLVLLSGQDRRIVSSASRLAAAHGLKLVTAFAKPFVSAELRECLIEQKEALRSGATGRLRRAPIQVRAARVEEAIAAGEIVVHYQPQVDVGSLAWVGVEALARWQHPELGLLPPDTFVPVAEHDPALCERLTLFMVERMLADMRQVSGELGFDGRIAVNTPADVVSSARFPDRLVEMAGRYGILPERLVLEVTETSLPTEPVRSLAIQTRLRMRGVSLAVDDFGTGHSGLERLRTFPMDELKLDLGFVRDSTSDPEARAIVQNSIALARDLRVRCIAEGVENAEALKLLAVLRCAVAQGFFIGRPMPAADLGSWLREWRQRSPALREAMA